MPTCTASASNLCGRITRSPKIFRSDRGSVVQELRLHFGIPTGVLMPTFINNHYDIVFSITVMALIVVVAETHLFSYSIRYTV